MPAEESPHAPVVLLGGDAPWIQALAVVLARSRSVIAVALTAGAVPAWPFPDAAGPEREVWSYPPGFNRRLRLLFDPVVRGRLNRLRARLRARSGQEPVVVASLPAYVHYVRDVPRERLIYWNYDDYTENGTRTAMVARERALIDRAGTVLCSSRFQRDRFRTTHPARVRDIVHFPHGVAAEALNPSSATVPSRTVCAVGHLTRRYDWRLIHAVASQLPDVEFRFVGGLDGPDSDPGDDWATHATACLALPNVVHIGATPYQETFAHTWRSAVAWLPYRADLPFVKACCPVKLGDGLASGRPVISAEVPEARLYPDWVRCFGRPEEAVRLIGDALCRSGTEAEAARAAAQVAFARTQGWDARAAALEPRLNGSAPAAAQ